jgi:hypothetical protein
METLVQVVLPAFLVFTTLFGLLSRGDPKPGGVALFWRVGLTGLAIGGVMAYLNLRTSALASTPAFVQKFYVGMLIGGALLTVFAAFGSSMKNKR